MPFTISKQNWFIKYKLYHIPFWILYDYVTWSIDINSPYYAAQEMFFSVYVVKAFFYMIFPAFAVYFNLYFLIPRYLQKGHYGWYFLFLAVTIVVCSSLILPGYYITSWLKGSTAQKEFGMSNTWNSFYQSVKGSPFKNTVGAITLAMSIKLTKNWIQTERRHRQLEKEKLETELKFLKYQFNPHFLFNSINSIFFLIHKNPDMASASLAKFSELLRHQLYECNEEQIPLSKELSYLENFIELEKLRQNENIQVKLDIENPLTGKLGIAPFVLMTFVENAFKHVSRNADKPNWIDIKLKINEQQLELKVANSSSADMGTDVINYGGIGLKNVQRRLDLVYPGQYELDIKNGEDNFDIKLKLNLKEVVHSNTMQIAAY